MFTPAISPAPIAVHVSKMVFQLQHACCHTNQHHRISIWGIGNVCPYHTYHQCRGIHQLQIECGAGDEFTNNCGYSLLKRGY